MDGGGSELDLRWRYLGLMGIPGLLWGRIISRAIYSSMLPEGVAFHISLMLVASPGVINL